MKKKEIIGIAKMSISPSPQCTKRKHNSPSKLICVESLTIPDYSSKDVISKADSLLSSFKSHLKPCQSPVWHCAFSTDGNVLATCHGRPDPCIRLFKHVKTDETNNCSKGWRLFATLRDIEGADSSSSRTIRSISFAPTPKNDRKVLAAASFNGSISIWEDFSRNSIDGNNRVFQNNTNPNMPCGWECTAQLEGHENEVKDVTWNATGTLLASCGRDKSVWIWECFLPGAIGGNGSASTTQISSEEDFECLAVLQSHEGDVKCVSFAPSHGQFGDGDEILLSASYDDTIKCWAEDGGEWYCALTLSSVHSSTIWKIAISPGGVRMMSCSADHSIGIWRCYTASEKREFTDEEGAVGLNTEGCWKCVGKLTSSHTQPIYSIDIARADAGHGRIVSGGGDNNIHVYREFGGTSDAPLFEIDAYAKHAHDGDVNCVKWAFDGRTIISGGDDGMVKIWKYR